MSSTCTSDFEHHYNHKSAGFFTPQPKWRMRRCSPAAPASERKPRASNERFHAIHKVPSGDSPYVRAKHVQLLDKDPSKAVSLFWSAINSGDRVESALKDMAVVMKQLDRSEEAIEAIKSFRHLCPPESQESIDNLLLELYKVAGKYEEEIEMLLLKIKQVEEDFAFSGKRTKIARSQGRKIEITIEKEYARLLGNLAWAYMQQKEFKSAEENYRKALLFESDKNKQCNLALCMMHMNKLVEAKFLLQAIRPSDDGQTDESYTKSYERACQTLADMESERARRYNSGFRCRQNRDGCQTAQTPPVPHFVNNTNKRMPTGIPCEKEPDSGRRSDCWSYNSPCSNRETPRAPFTQPRRSSSSFNNRDQRKSEERFCRKLPFGPCTEGKNWQSLMNRNPCNYSADYSVSPKVQLPSPRREWRKNFVQLPAQECDLAPDSTSMADSTKADTSSNVEPNQSPSFSSIRASDAETEKAYESQTRSGKMSELSMSERKKSWADLVEEDEQEPERWRQQFTVDFADNGGIIINCETPQQFQKSSEKFESLEAGGYFTQPDKVNQKVKRSLCFGQGNYENPCTSPFQTRAFELEGH